MAGTWDKPLDALRWHWGDVYSVHHPEPGVWTARRRDNSETLLSATAEGLREKIRADYAARPVSLRQDCGQPPEGTTA